jgi:LysM repeat protein
MMAQPKDKSHELKKMSIEEYVRTYAPIAKTEMRNHGIPASITLAQGILESNFGNSPLAREANNHFGIKCHTGWQGKGYYMNDDAINECFRIYDKAEESFHDHSDFLKSRPRYAELFKLDPKDYKGWARGLQAAGYATNPQYANLIIRIIEERNLHQYDTADPELTAKLETKEDVIKVFENKVLVFNGLKIVVAQPQQTITQIGEKFNIPYKNLKKFNDILNDDDTNYYLIPGAKVYLQQKKSRGFGVTHRVQENETMHSISQKEGIRLADLYKLNLMKAGEEPALGEILQLRKKAKKMPRLKSQVETDKLYKKIKKLTAKEKPEEEIETLKGIGPAKEEPKNEPVVQKEPEKPKQEVKREEPKKEDAKKEQEQPVTQSKSSEPIYHTVEPKQTLYSISLMYNVRVEDIQDWNKLKSNALNVGQQLIVGYTNEKIKSAEELRVKKPNMTPVYHTVKPRETLMSIAAWYDVRTEI